MTTSPSTRTLLDRVTSFALIGGTIFMIGLAIWQRLPARPMSQVTFVDKPFVTTPPKGTQRLGLPTAEYTVVEFTDFYCPFCRRFEEEIFDEVKRTLIDTGRIEFIVVNRPLQSLHPKAPRAAEIAECAAQQGQYWAMRRVIFANATVLEEPALIASAGTAGVDIAAVRKCLERGSMKTRVIADTNEAVRLQINSTPIYLVGKRDGQGGITVSAVARGVNSAKVLEDAIGARPQGTWLSALSR